MSESAQVLAFFQDRDALAAKARLRGVQKHHQDFAQLEELYENALLSLKWCYDKAHWSLTLKFMEALEQFLHLQGQWQEAEGDFTASRRYGEWTADMYLHLGDTLRRVERPQQALW